MLSGIGNKISTWKLMIAVILFLKAKIILKGDKP
jgi:hypothetical protein